MTFRIIDFEHCHMDEILSHPPSEGSLIKWRNPTGEDNFSRYEHPGTSFSFIDDGHVIATFGLLKMWEGVWHIWFYGTNKVHKHPISILRFIDRKIPILSKENNIKRIQTQIHTDWEKAKKSIEILGFTQDGFFKHYGPDGSDYYNYMRLL